MPHYRDGTKAKVGDRVRGVGYNRDRMKYPEAGIEGIVVDVRPGESCTLTVAFLSPAPTAILNQGTQFEKHSTTGNAVAAGTPVMIETEYGDTKCFEKIG